MTRSELYRVYRTLPWRVRYYAYHYNVEMEDAVQEHEAFKLIDLPEKKWMDGIRLSLYKQRKDYRDTSIHNTVFDNENITYEEALQQREQQEDGTIERVENALRSWRDAGILTDGQAVAIYHRIIDEWSFNRIDKEYDASHDKARRNFNRGIERLQRNYANVEVRRIRNEFHFFVAM